MAKKNIYTTIGADPEFFVKHKGEFISPFGLIPGNKKLPFTVDHGAIQVDGLAVEFNIQPQQNYQNFEKIIEKVRTTLIKKLPEGYEPCFDTKAEFHPDYWEVLPSFQKQIGCDPDFNAYTEAQNSYPPSLAPVRYAGGHIHIGWTKDQDVTDELHFMNCCEVVKALDLYLGYPSLFVDPDNERLRTYGQMGNFRPKPYGVEYRTLSNFWISKIGMPAHVCIAAIDAIHALHNGVVIHPDDLKIVRDAFESKTLGKKITFSTKLKNQSIPRMDGYYGNPY